MTPNACLLRRSCVDESCWRESRAECATRRLKLHAIKRHPAGRSLVVGNRSGQPRYRTSMVQAARGRGEGDESSVDHPGRVSGLPWRGVVLARFPGAGESSRARSLPAAFLGRGLQGRCLAQRHAGRIARRGRDAVHAGCDRQHSAGRVESAGRPRAQSHAHVPSTELCSAKRRTATR